MTAPFGPAPTADSQIPEVYARQPVLHRLVPRMVGLDRDRHRRRAHHEFADDLPVVLLSGRHGTGKSAMLDDLQQAYAPETGTWPGPRVPFARINCTELQEQARVGPEMSNNSYAVEMLVELIAQLSRPVAGFGGLRFPRTTAGLLAVVSARRPGHDGELRVADRHAATLMGVPPDTRPRPTWDTLFRPALPAPPTAAPPTPRRSPRRPCAPSWADSAAGTPRDSPPANWSVGTRPTAARPTTGCADCLRAPRDSRARCRRRSAHRPWPGCARSSTRAAASGAASNAC
ncbi:hypothetical protein BC342_14420 [Streptomyces olivaceus]|nr:hypothetical protein BC342_14420 [Streptomyces olivaceus]